MHEYDSLRAEHTSTSLGMVTLGVFLCTTIVALFGFAVQSRQLLMLLGIPALGLGFSSQLLRMYMGANYIAIHLRSIENRVNTALGGEHWLSWESDFSPARGLDGSSDGSWDKLVAEKFPNKAASVFLVLFLVLSIVSGLVIGGGWLLRGEAGYGWLGISAIIFWVAYALLVFVWGSALLWTFRAAPTHIEEGELAHGAKERELRQGDSEVRS